MPYSAKQTRSLKAISKGWKPRSQRVFKNVSRTKAASMLKHTQGAKQQANALERVQKSVNKPR